MYSLLSLTLITPVSIRITPTFIIGLSLILLCAYIRTACYRALGHFFTFEVSILPKQKLVTSGPYAWVRHPSYTGALFGLAGVAVMVLSNGSWARECGWLGTKVGNIFKMAFMLCISGFSIVFVWRTYREDELLKEEFGLDWETWRRSVRYKLVPWIY
ncbi:hypothetical protein EW146_g7339 [Bondarzewia mesenterica]|uniref:Protein-S-isoprenylcysteine O-methyltransferase n=1 Tax=Bondarzewia mesenterica TaxID=1095465 RepID=A0A4S4LL06_9AGAM|nr:hypothetical protein EW146_g7339 [Bondarzewia mesenterica]